MIKKKQPTEANYNYCSFKTQGINLFESKSPYFENKFGDKWFSMTELERVVHLIPNGGNDGNQDYDTYMRVVYAIANSGGKKTLAENWGKLN